MYTITVKINHRFEFKNPIGYAYCIGGLGMLILKGGDTYVRHNKEFRI